MNSKNLMLLVLWHDLFRISRRARRSEFWWGFLCLLIFSFLAPSLFVVVTLFIMILVGATDDFVLTSIAPGVVIGWVWPFIALATLTIRRLHDLNLSGWWYAALIVGSIISGMFVAPFAGLIFEMQKPPIAEIFAGVYYLGLFTIGVSPPSSVDNRWGPAPTAM